MINLLTQRQQWESAVVSPLIGTVGGAISGTQVVDAVRGEWFPQLEAAASGSLYSSLAQQWQKTFIGHDDVSQTLAKVSVFVANGVKTPGVAGFISLQSTDPADSSVYKGLFYSDVAGSLAPVSVGLNGTTLSTGGTVVNRIFRGELVNATTGAHYDPTGLVQVFVNGVSMGFFLPGIGWVTNEINIALVADTSDTGENSTSTSPLVAPSGISTFYEAFLVADALPCRNDPTNSDLAPTQFQGVWGQMTLQPGMPTSSNVKVVLGIKGTTS